MGDGAAADAAAGPPRGRDLAGVAHACYGIAMRVAVQHKEALEALKPLDVLSYARSTGWRETSHVRDRSSAWALSKDGDEYEILIPLRTDFSDYAARIVDALQTLSVAEGRSQLALLGDLYAIAADVVRVRALPPHAEDGTLPLRDGVALLESASDLLTFAACAALTPRQIYSNRRPQQVSDYTKSLRLGQTERGSYIVTIACPVPPALSPAERGLLFDTPEPEPFPRRVTATLARALLAMHDAAEQSDVTGDVGAWEAAVVSGVSANLCEAMVGLAGQSKRGDVEVLFSWSLRRPPSQGTPRGIRFTSDTVGYVEEAARWYRRSHPTEDSEIRGEVIALDNNPRHPETATILGFIEGKPRRVGIALSDTTRALAIRSYQEHLPVTCLGTLVRAGRQYELREMHELALDAVE